MYFLSLYSDADYLSLRFFGITRRSTIAKKSTGQARSEVFEDISKRTGAFVKPPAYHDRVSISCCKEGAEQ